MQVDMIVGDDSWRLQGTDPAMLKARDFLLGRGARGNKSAKAIDALVKQYLERVEELSLFLEKGSFLDDPWAKHGPRGAEWREGWAKLDSLEEWLNREAQ